MQSSADIHSCTITTTKTTIAATFSNCWHSKATARHNIAAFMCPCIIVVVVVVVLVVVAVIVLVVVVVVFTIVVGLISGRPTRATNNQRVVQFWTMNFARNR